MFWRTRMLTKRRAMLKRPRPCRMVVLATGAMVLSVRLNRLCVARNRPRRLVMIVWIWNLVTLVLRWLMSVTALGSPRARVVRLMCRTPLVARSVNVRVVIMFGLSCKFRCVWSPTIYRKVLSNRETGKLNGVLSNWRWWRRLIVCIRKW